MSEPDKQGLAVHLLFAALGGLLGSPFLALASALAWLVARDWAGLSIVTTVYGVLLSWMVFAVVSACIGKLIAPAHTDRLTVRQGTIVEYASWAVGCVAGFAIVADRPWHGAIVGVCIAIVLLGVYEWVTSRSPLTEEQEQEGWARFNADLRKEFGRDDDENQT